MTIKKRGLGRGLDALLGISDGRRETAPLDGTPDTELRNLPIDLIQQGRYQPRVDMHADSLEDLASSIKAQGVVQPIVVRRLPGEGRFEIIAGERRWRAAQMAGLHEIPCVVRDVPDQAVISMALIENIQREDLNPLEEANALARLIDEFGLTHQQAAEAVGRSRAAVSNLLRLRELADDARQLLGTGQIEMGHARSLLALPGPQQGALARQVVARGLSVRETERLVRRALASAASTPSSAQAPDPDVKRLEEEIGERLGAAVSIRHGRKGRGVLVINYGSLDELDGILAHIK